MMLPMTAHTNPAGVARAVRDFVQAMGKPAIVYIRQANYMAPEELGRLVSGGQVCAVKYAVDRPSFREDPYLAQLVDTVGPEQHRLGFWRDPGGRRISTPTTWAASPPAASASRRACRCACWRR